MIVNISRLVAVLFILLIPFCVFAEAPPQPVSAESNAASSDKRAETVTAAGAEAKPSEEGTSAPAGDAPVPPAGDDDVTIRVEEKVVVVENPHTAGEKGCPFCHQEGKEKEGVLREKTVGALCADCHKQGKPHFIDSFPYGPNGLKREFEKLGFTIPESGMNCITCHDRHAESGKEFHLMAEVYDFFIKVRSINPHWRQGFCYACHRENPKKRPFAFKWEGDMIKVCNYCHETLSADKLIHAVGMVPSRKIRARIPVSFALSEDGSLNCITCHELKYQCLEEEFYRKESDSLFFRDGPYEERTDICFRCHQRDVYERLNPHDQINDEGELMTEVCTYCHAQTPDPQKDKSIGSVEFVTEKLKDLCQRCHRDRPHPGGAFINFDHLVEPPNKIKFWIKMAEKNSNLVVPLEPDTDKIFCCTCHNPHERGVLRDKFGRGSDDDRRLRMGAGFELCSICHQDKAGPPS
ncbi:MAG: hypothetical protein OEV42_16285 [Deltaproteobacteria bacterium]|nr:hypothetical protein [Deltaproteobacteria bacterium]